MTTPLRPTYETTLQIGWSTYQQWTSRIAVDPTDGRPLRLLLAIDPQTGGADPYEWNEDATLRRIPWSEAERLRLVDSTGDRLAPVEEPDQDDDTEPSTPESEPEPEPDPDEDDDEDDIDTEDILRLDTDPPSDEAILTVAAEVTGSTVEDLTRPWSRRGPRDTLAVGDGRVLARDLFHTCRTGRSNIEIGQLLGARTGQSVGAWEPSDKAAHARRIEVAKRRLQS